MNKEIVKQIFPEMMERVEAGNCPTCNQPIAIDSFRDSLSRKEFQISGMCQKCQDSVFGG